MATLTEDQKDLLRQTWAMIEGHDLRRVGVAMYSKLFRDNPAIVPLFTFTRKKTADGRIPLAPLQKHSTGVMKMVGSSVLLLDDMQEMQRKFTELGSMHKKYGAKPKYFDAVGSAMFATFTELLGDLMSEEAVKAWKMLFVHITSIMTLALNS